LFNFPASGIFDKIDYRETSPQNCPVFMSREQGQDDSWTVLRLLEWTTGFFKTKASQSPRLDAEILLAHACDCSRIELYAAFDTVPGEQQRTAFRELVRRRGDGVPVAQLVGYKEFYSLRLRINEDVLIPRPETEHVVIEVLDVVKAAGASDRPLQIADVGTGSGAIAIALAKHLPNAQVTAVDLNDAALDIARWNARQHDVHSQISFFNSDLLAGVEQPETFDILCSNPPYVSTAEYTELAPTVRDHEPRTALVAGEKGTEVIWRIIHECGARITPGGRLVIELSPMIADRCAELAGEAGFDDGRFIKDLAGHRRVLSLRK